MPLAEFSELLPAEQLLRLVEAGLHPRDDVFGVLRRRIHLLRRRLLPSELAGPLVVRRGAYLRDRHEIALQRVGHWCDLSDRLGLRRMHLLVRDSRRVEHRRGPERIHIPHAEGRLLQSVRHRVHLL